MSFDPFNFLLVFTINLHWQYIGMQPVTLPITKQQDMEHIVYAMQCLTTRQVKTICSITYPIYNPECSYASLPKFPGPLQSKVTC